ncbi:hypothetical protein GCM10011375_12300 [Hymenobacter qilianensis]|nr:hypothetical protein GCM10011375_12300 [Hymenobacter qilianensis]
MEQELWFGDHNQRFEFHRRVLPKIDIATSAVFGGAIRPVAITYLQAQAINPLHIGFTPLSQPRFIHLIPRATDLVSIVGYVKHSSQRKIKGVLISEIEELPDENFRKLISDIVVSIQTWGISESLYETWEHQGTITTILDAIESFVTGSQQLISLPTNGQTATDTEPIGTFNMFDTP